MHSLLSLISCCFGVKKHPQFGLFVSNINPNQLGAADTEEDPGKLGQALIEVLFSHQELKNGCTTKPRKAGILKLDGHLLQAIRGTRGTVPLSLRIQCNINFSYNYAVHIFHRFPVEGGFHSVEETKRRNEIKKLKLNVNVRCRQHRGKDDDGDEYIHEYSQACALVPFFWLCSVHVVLHTIILLHVHRVVQLA